MRHETVRASAVMAHFLCFVLPVTTLAFLLTAPHQWSSALPWLAVVVASIAIDAWSQPEMRVRSAPLPRWLYDATLLALVVLALSNVILGARTISSQGFWRIDTAVACILVGINSGYSGIVVAHELIHRRGSTPRLAGRLLMALVLYEHFSTEHIRGHHLRVGTKADAATATFGETAWRHLFRNLGATFASAWRLECTRLGDPAMHLLDLRQARNHVVHGVIAEVAIAILILSILDGGALAFHGIQAFIAVALLECVNFFEHWGLARTSGSVTAVEAWETGSWFSRFTLLSLTRHSDHHVHPTRPFHALDFSPDSPQLPAGYFGMVVLAYFFPRIFQSLMTAELRRRKLGPFALSTTAPLGLTRTLTPLPEVSRDQVL